MARRPCLVSLFALICFFATLLAPALAQAPVGAVQEFERARTYASGEKWKEAIVPLERALKMDPGYGDALYLASICYMQLEQFDKALPLLKRLTNLRPEFFNGWGLLSQLYVQTDRYDEARTAIGELSKAKGGAPESHYMLGVLAWKEKNLEQAAKEWKEAIRLKPDLAKAHHNLGVLYRLKGDRVRSLQSLSDAVRLNSENPLYRFNLGVLQLELGNKIDGNASLDRVRAQTDRPDLASLSLAAQLLAAGKAESAIKSAQRALQQNKELSEAYLIIAKANEQLKNHQEAKSNYEVTFKMEPNCQEAERALKGYKKEEERLAAEKAAAEAKAKEEALQKQATSGEASPEASDSDKAPAISEPANCLAEPKSDHQKAGTSEGQTAK